MSEPRFTMEDLAPDWNIERDQLKDDLIVALRERNDLNRRLQDVLTTNAQISFDLVTVTTQRDTLLRRLAEAEALLREIEWWEPECMFCDTQKELGHTSHCRLRELLGEVT